MDSETITGSGARACQCQGLKKAGLIALDAAKFHRTALVKETLAQHSIIPSLIPGGTTGLIQVVDVCVNRSFKAILKDVMDEIIDGLGEEALLWLDDISESAVGRRRILMTRAVGEAWERVSAMITHTNTTGSS